ncbi:hypothetical protein [Nonomuraea sp. B1E8]|uniref:hypothetical protein n=1 Tax=unclassified Nonomuraea TaxID=2593643 RepID=UPI00325E3745
MTTLDDPARLLEAWERAASAPPVTRGPVLLHSAGLLPDLDTALEMPLGLVAVLAARLYADAFGGVADVMMTCGCGEVLEVALPLEPITELPTGESGEACGGALRVRPPSARDLLMAAQADDALAALLTRCVRDATGGPISPAQLTADQLATVDAIAEGLAGAAAVMLRAHCPACESVVAVSLDVAELLWERVAAHAPALLAEVATLATAFGWAEAEILALPAGRRRAYLALAAGRTA